MFGSSIKLHRRNLVRKGQFWLQKEAVVIATLQGSSDNNITGKQCRGEKQAEALNIIWNFSKKKNHGATCREKVH